MDIPTFTDYDRNSATQNGSETEAKILMNERVVGRR